MPTNLRALAVALLLGSSQCFLNDGRLGCASTRSATKTSRGVLGANSDEDEDGARRGPPPALRPKDEKQVGVHNIVEIC